MSFDAFIFDFDGVLCDSAQAHKSAFIEALLNNCNKCSVPTHHVIHWCECKENLYESIKHKKTIDKLKTFARNNIIQHEHIHQINTTKQQLTIKNISMLRLDARVLNNLTFIKDTKAMMTAIASDASRQTINEFLKRNKASRLFDVITTSEDVAGAVKPSPDVYVTTLNKLGLDASHCVAFEDTDDGVLAARTANINTVEFCIYKNLYDKLVLHTGVNDVF